MNTILTWQQIEPLIQKLDVYDAMKNAFVQYSLGNAEIPPVGELIMDDPEGEVHIKYGYLKGGKHYVIKIASGFPGNEQLGLIPGQGMMLLFNLTTGEPEAILIDDANLTVIRTGIAGAIASQALCNKNIKDALIVGTGVQARYQARYLCDIMSINKLSIWGRDTDKAKMAKDDLADLNIEIETQSNLEESVKASRLIITTTSAKEPILKAGWIQPGTHITSVGSDTPEKCELDFNILSKADIIIADSIEQNLIRGEIHQAIKNKAIDVSQLIEIGEIFDGTKTGRTTEDQISIVDLTGVAIQDLVIAEAVLSAHRDK
jgi:ornithine cyclodeaminase|tara:strand:- start:2897 stop:3850 length:954 start_codon:yes stop_codon:yes gene_type:complete